MTAPVTTADLARLVAHMGVKLAQLTARVEELEGGDQARVSDQMRAAEILARAKEKNPALRRTMVAARRTLAGGGGAGADSVGSIVAAVAVETGLTPTAILSDMRQGPIVRARQEVYARALDAGFSSIAVGRAMGRDHSTVLYGANLVWARRKAQVAA